MTLLSFLARELFPSPRFPNPFLAVRHRKLIKLNRHALRKSGLYTSLDFAPPPRFRNDPSRPGSPLVPPNASFNETGSIRSQSATGGRGGAMSPMGLAAVRSGAYRVENLPKSSVGTMQDLSQELKPHWDIGRQ